MSEREFQQCQKDVADIRRLLYGDPATAKGGLAHAVDTLGTTLYGTDRNPGGLYSDVVALKRYMWMAAGAVTAVQFGIQILFHFWPK